MHMTWYALSRCIFLESKNDQGQITACIAYCVLPYRTFLEFYIGQGHTPMKVDLCRLPRHTSPVLR